MTEGHALEGRSRRKPGAGGSGGGAAQAGQGLGQDGLAVGIAAALLHVGEVRLVGLDAGRIRRGVLVLARGVTTAGALPGVRDRGVRREARTRLVPVRAPERDPYS